MQIKIFTLPVFGSGSEEDKLNLFLRSHRILQVERHFCADSGGYWAVMVEYVLGDPSAENPPASRRERKDFSEGLSEEEKQRYEAYKSIRKEIALQRSIPAYLVFTNEELANMSRLPELTEESVRRLKGIAPQRLRDYGKYFYDTTETDEAGGSLDGEDSQLG